MAQIRTAGLAAVSRSSPKTVRSVPGRVWVRSHTPASQSASARWRSGANAPYAHRRHARDLEGNATGSQATSCREHA